jgi:hypothetical protein
MKEHYILKLFIKFLKENNVYEEYLIRLNSSKGGKEKSIKYIVKQCKYQPLDLIMDAFPWISLNNINSKLKWSDLHREWYFYYLNKME